MFIFLNIVTAKQFDSSEMLHSKNPSNSLYEQTRPVDISRNIFRRPTKHLHTK